MKDLILRTAEQTFNGFFIGAGILIGMTTFAKFAMWIGWIPTP